MLHVRACVRVCECMAVLSERAAVTRLAIPKVIYNVPSLSRESYAIESCMIAVTPTNRTLWPAKARSISSSRPS